MRCAAVVWFGVLGEEALLSVLDSASRVRRHSLLASTALCCCTYDAHSPYALMCHCMLGAAFQENRSDQMLHERQQGQQPPLLPPLPEQQQQAANTRGSWPSLQGSWAGVAAEDSQAHYWRADGQPEAARMASEQRSGEAAHTGGQQLNGAGISGWEGEAGGHRLASEARQLDAGAGWAPGMEWEGQAAGPV